MIALGDNIRTIDPIGSPSVDAASERVRTLMFNSLVKKDEKFDYVGELASDIKRSDDNLSVHIYSARRRQVSRWTAFHLGRREIHARSRFLRAAFAKSASFYEGTGRRTRKSYIKSVEAPDAQTLVVTTVKPWTGLLQQPGSRCDHSQRQLSDAKRSPARQRAIQVR